MKIRTVYFKVRRIDEALAWWSSFLGVKPAKSFPPWHEFRVGEINFGLLALDDASGGSRCVPVFEFPDNEIEERIARAKELGATAVLEGEDHPDYPNTAAVLRDPFGNEFEVTNYGG